MVNDRKSQGGTQLHQYRGIVSVLRTIGQKQGPYIPKCGSMI